MFDMQDRRSALAKLAAGAAAAGVAVREMTAGADAQPDADAAKRKRKKSGRVTYYWRLPWGSAMFKRRPGSDPIRYNATVGAFGKGYFEDRISGRERTINDRQLERIINRKTNNGNMKGIPQIRLEGMNWRVFHADYDPDTRTWQMDLKVCDSNPNARPDTTPADLHLTGAVDAQDDGANNDGCTCDCDSYSCYICLDGGAACGSDCSAACPDGCRE